MCDTEDLPRATTFLSMEADCPHCSEVQSVEWIEPGETVEGHWQCESCEKEFTYRHPECHLADD